MEFLVYTTPSLAKAVSQKDATNDAFKDFERILIDNNACVAHVSEKFSTLVVDVPDSKADALEQLFSTDAAWKSHISLVEPLLFQVRVNLGDAFAKAARSNPADPSLRPINDILVKYDAVLKNQFDAFVGFCKESEDSGHTDTVLYRWTKSLVDNPAKQEHYATRFTIYAEGGNEVYSRHAADGLEADLTPLVGGGMIERLSKFNTDPAQNPQAGPEFR